MSAEPSQTTIADAWSQWHNQVVQGRFVLRRCLGWSDQSAVFLTEHKAKSLTEAAIKFVRADAPQAQPLLVRWQAAVNVSHAHLVQLFEVGRWQSEGQDYLFVVMEYGDQTLAEILRRRPLDADEVHELLPPVLDALTFLHRRQLVHSQLKPSNFLAVGDQLKLASDTIRPASQDHGNSTAGDVWSLGATLLEALTARPRISVDQLFDEAVLPAGLPATLVETVRRCLSASPADRPPIIELRAEYKRAPQVAAAPAKPEPQAQKVSAPPPVAPASSKPAVSAAPVATSIPPVAPVSSKPAVSAGPVATSVPPVTTVSSKPAVSAAPVATSVPPVTTVSSKPAVSAAPVAASIPPVTIASREPVPYQPVQTASRVTVSFHAVPGNVPAPAQAQPVSSASPAVSQPKPVRQDIAPPTPTPVPRPATATAASQAPALSPAAPSPTSVTAPRPPAAPAAQAAVTSPAAPVPRAITSPQAANITSRVPTPTEHASSARDSLPSQIGNIGTRAAVSSQPASSAPRDGGLPQAVVAPKAAPAVQPIRTAPQAIAPPLANIAPRAVSPIQPPPSTLRASAQPTQGSPPQAPAENAPKRHFVGIALGGLLLATAVWIGLQSTNESPAPLQPAAIPAKVQPAPEEVAESKPTLTVPPPPPAEQPALPATTSASVLNEVLPNVPEKIQSEIQGRIYVTVRALVDPDGNVMAVLMENAGPSKYFARISDKAAREWQFVAADTDAARVWLLRFEYTRDGASVRASEQ